MSAKSGPREGECLVGTKGPGLASQPGKAPEDKMAELKDKEGLGVMKLLGRMESPDQSPREQGLPGADGRSGWLDMENIHGHLGSGLDLVRWGLTWAGTHWQSWFRH